MLFLSERGVILSYIMNIKCPIPLPHMRMNIPVKDVKKMVTFNGNDESKNFYLNSINFLIFC